MFNNRNYNLIQFIVLLTTLAHILSKEQQSSNQLFHILSSLKPIRSQYCQFKFENCIQDSSYADQLDTICNIYSRLRDCFRTLLDDLQCSTLQIKHQYKKIRQNEYEACGISASYQSVRSSSSWSTSLSRKLQTTYMIIFNLFVLTIYYLTT